MNKHNYKLIFSRSKGCLVPVAEFINAVTEKSCSEKKEGKISLKSYRLSLITESIGKAMKCLPSLLLALPVAAHASSIEVDQSAQNKPKVNITQNNVAVIDIVKPEANGISDNRFHKFNVENGAVFKNNKEGMNSHLVGYLEKNSQLGNTEARAILTQVTGKETTTLKGGLEVLGKKADLLIVNPNGININGVQTFNSDRFVATTSEVIDPKNGLNLSVNKGQIEIGENGLATDGLKYVDIVAKKIHQKGAIKHDTSKANNPAANITFVAGSSEYDVDKGIVKSKNASTTEDVILAGTDTASMYGNHVRFVVTDTGAGVKHQGVILSERDIVIESKNGNVALNHLQSKQNVTVKNSADFSASEKVTAENITIQSNKATLNNNATLSAKNETNITANVTLNDKSKIRSKSVKIKAKEIKTAENATVIGTNVSLATSKLANNGAITARNLDIDTDKLDNKGSILAKNQLNISLQGVIDVTRNTDERLYLDSLNNYKNTGVIQSSNNASLNLKNKTNFSAFDYDNLPQAKNTLTISANKFTVQENKKVEVLGNLTIKSNLLFNDGVLTAGQYLNITNQDEIKNSGLIGSGKGYEIITKSGVITNERNAVLHSGGTSFLKSSYGIVNNGSIISKGKLKIDAIHLLNNTDLNDRLSELSLNKISKRRFSPNIARNDIYILEISLNDFNDTSLDVLNIGRIQAEDGFEFIQNQDRYVYNGSELVEGIDNHGVINVKGEFNIKGTTHVNNAMKSIKKDAIKDYLYNTKNRVVIKFQPIGSLLGIEGKLAGESSKTYSSIGAFLDDVLKLDHALESGWYSGYTPEFLKELKNVESAQLQSVLTQILGQNWEHANLATLRERWYKIKLSENTLHFYPKEKAKILADRITGDIGKLNNGSTGETGNFGNNVDIGDTKINLPNIQFKEFNTAETDNSSSEIDLGVLLELLSSPNLFIDRSLQLDKPKESPPAIQPDKDDENLLKETDEEKAERDRRAKKAAEEARRKAQEEKRKAEEEKKRQKELEKEKQRQAEEALKEKHRKEKEALEKKIAEEKLAKEQREALKRELAEKQRKEREELAEKARKEKLEKEKQRQAELRRLEEYQRKLAEEKRKADELAKQRALLEEKNNRSRVEVDPLYHTQAKYIDQNEYVGADYLLNKLEINNKSQSKVKVIGDNYFQHQLITRSIEKKVDNHLSLKYDLSNNQLVQRLMDNAAANAKSLNLTVGKPLTREQQASLKEDIIWYVKSEIKGQEVLIPQVYLSEETLADAKKYQGLGNAVIKAREIDLKVKELNNSGTIAANNLNVEAEGKIKNSGDLLAKNNIKLKGQEGVELISKTVADEKGNTVTQRSNVISGGHIHLESGSDRKIDLTAANVKGKTGFIKAKELNVKDTYETSSSNTQKVIHSRLTGLEIGTETESKASVKSVGSNVEFDHLHLALKGDLNQQGSQINTEKTTGIVQGNLNAKAGKNIEKVDKSKQVTALEISASANGFGYSASSNYSEHEGESTNTGRGEGAALNLDVGLALVAETESRSALVHTNSQLNAKSGELHVLGNADIGGVDINKGVVAESDANSTASQPAATETKAESLELVDRTLADSRARKDRDLQGLTQAQIDELMAEKGAAFYEAEKQKGDKDGFKLSAKSISSTKEKDTFSEVKQGFKLKVGAESEAHSAIADLASGVAKHALDTSAGLKQDGTIVLQHASEVANVATGDLAGFSAKRKIELSQNASNIQQSQDVRSSIGGKTTLVAREGDITLKNVESNANSQVTLTAKENINLLSGESHSKEVSGSFSQKLYEGASVSCGAMTGGCAVGVNSGVEGSAHRRNVDDHTHQNTLLQGQQIVLNAGKDLNLNGAKVQASQVNVDVQGKTNIASVQDNYNRTEHNVNLGFSGGASINTSLQVKPTGSITAGYGYEYEQSKKVAQQSGIEADRIVGEIHDLNLQAGHIVDRSKGKDFTIKGDVTHQDLKDSHHKDGGNFGGTIGINERGTAQINLRGGRVEQKHYDATQKSTLDGVKSAATDINTNINQSKTVERDDRLASTKFEFEVLDIAELGQKAGNKLKSKISPRSAGQSDSNVQNRSRNEAVYEEIADAPYGKVGDSNADFRRAQPSDDGVYSEIQLPKTKAEPIYEEIGQPKAKVESTYAEVGQPKAKVESTYAEVGQPKTQAESVYAEAAAPKTQSDPTYAEVTPRAKRNVENVELVGKPAVESVYAEATQPKAKVEPIYEEIPNRPTAETIYAEATQPKAQRPLPELPNAPKTRVEAEGDYATIDEVKPQSNNLAKRALPELPEAPKTRVEAEGDYATIDEVKPQSNNRAKRALPDVPNAPKAAAEVEGDYSTIPEVSPKAKAAAESDYAEIPALTPKASQPESGEVVAETQPKAKTEVAEGLYAQVDKSPEALAKAKERTADIPLAKPAAEAEEAAPALPKRPSETAENAKTEVKVVEPVQPKAAETVVETAQAEAPKKAEKAAKEAGPSFLDKVKNFFKGSDSKTAKKAEKAPKADENAAPSYDNLPDNLNLKGLLSLENQRNADFDSKVLKNPEFLAEAKDAAKKYIPEATIKQMGDSPEFNEILTEGARKVEQRINDAITFKPTAEEFSNIQDLVKQLPKGSVLENTNAMTDSITDALASTSKTIQKNPELKEQIRGAIDEFLTSSKGKDLTVEMIEKLNHGLRPDEGADRQLYKKETLTKENAVFSSPEASKIQLAETVDFINKARQSGVEPSVLAGLVYQRLIAYHPFAEGNGRMARVLVNKILLDNGYPPFTKFNESFETQIIPQTNTTEKSASSSQVVSEFLKELSKKELPKGSDPVAKTGDDLQNSAQNRPLVESQVNNKAQRTLPELPAAPKANAEGDYAEISDLANANSNNNGNQKKAGKADESDYATIDEVKPQANAQAKRALPEVPNAPKVAADADGDYSTIPDAAPKAKPAQESDYAEIPAETPKASQPKTSEAVAEVQPKAKISVEEGLYATVDKSPEALAKAKERTADIPLAKPTAEVEDVAPALPKRPTETAETEAKASEATQPKVTNVVEAAPKAAETVVEVAQAETSVPKKAEAPSLLDKVKNLFRSSDAKTAKKAAKPDAKAAEENAAPNYDNLPDNLNLKGLLSLENQRNADFDSKVLKNPEFLAEAKEAAKKYIPEATIKQMGDSPEFNEILTEGARKVEKRINDAITFKPTAEEFGNIQSLVKQLPKGSVLENTEAMTDSITDALASTSKTIQKNPELKSQIRGAIDEFLVNSKGKELTVEMIEKLNHGLRPDEGADRQLYKKETLTKENAVFSSPEASKIQLAETVDFINKARQSGVEPSVLAGLVYQRLIAYHPFAEGNGRMARVLVNKILLDSGYPPFTKFNESFETQIIPQTNSTAKSATSSEVVSEFLKELGTKSLPVGSEPIAKSSTTPSVEVQDQAPIRPLVDAAEEPKAAEPAKKATPIDDKVQSQELVEQQRSLAQQVKDKFQPLRVGKKIKDVRDSVEEFGGEVSFKFAQSKGEVFNEIIKHTETQNGACEATCAFWIAKKVDDDQSLFKELYPNGKEGKLDKQAFEKIKKLQTDFINSGSSATQQFKFTESWLNEQGVTVKQKQVGEFSRKDEVAGTVTNTDVKALTHAILDTGADNAGVKKISINLKGGSHTVAAAVNGEKVTFFDPNFGEITFKSRQQFETWFKDAFWSKSGYAGNDSGKRFFNVINYNAK